MADKLLAQLVNPVIPLIGEGSVEKGGEVVGRFISSSVGGLFIVAFIMALIYLITGAVHWITSGGDKANLESARNKITHAIVGLIIVGATWAIMIVVGQFFGLDFSNLPIPSITTQQQNIIRNTVPDNPDIWNGREGLDRQ